MDSAPEVVAAIGVCAVATFRIELLIATLSCPLCSTTETASVPPAAGAATRRLVKRKERLVCVPGGSKGTPRHVKVLVPYSP